MVTKSALLRWYVLLAGTTAETELLSGISVAIARGNVTPKS